MDRFHVVLFVTLLASAALILSIQWGKSCSVRETFDLSSSCNKANFKQQLDAGCVEDTECQSETQRCAKESVCVEEDWENLWSRKTYLLRTGGRRWDSRRHLYLTHIPEKLRDWQQPLSKMKAQCLEDEKCRGFCNNPDDWTYFYSITNQGTRNVGQYGEGWSCFLKPSHSWQALRQHGVTHFLANPPAVQRPQWVVTFETAKNLCIEGQCEAFCWNPDDWTYIYPTKPGSWSEACCYGQGWQCFERK